MISIFIYPNIKHFDNDNDHNDNPAADTAADDDYDDDDDDDDDDDNNDDDDDDDDDDDILMIIMVRGIHAGTIVPIIGGSSGRAVGYYPRGPGFDSQSGPSEIFIAPLCPPSTKWVARSLKIRRK
ncbi:hypothetical protein PoB_002228200 [Plakobranchus ocellatus]|uniref:Uncharacterized protein n=1 Tax=Plakobranchus ocellatus TaxID=259542 RepID=A0AAV3ZKI6_9GAST|nr:hypothetical protein PoB_002228200 [Plakobranchus ocellatus]